MTGMDECGLLPVWKSWILSNKLQLFQHSGPTALIMGVLWAHAFNWHPSLFKTDTLPVHHDFLPTISKPDQWPACSLLDIMLAFAHTTLICGTILWCQFVKFLCNC